jgi:hypothetical protein
MENPPRIIPVVFAMLLFVAVGRACNAQATTGQKPADSPACDPAKTTPNKPCPPPGEKKHPSAADQFPFPGETETPAASKAPSAPDAPTPNSAGTKHSSAADEHPFPGDAPGADAGSSSSSSSSSSADPNDAKPDNNSDTNADDTPSVRRKLPKVEKPQSDEDRATEDLKVAKFYEDRGNLNAAYLRTKDAVSAQPDDPYTHFALAHIAQKMGKRDEAIAEFNTYLKLDPDGLKIKEASKALAQLQQH